MTQTTGTVMVQTRATTEFNAPNETPANVRFSEDMEIDCALNLVLASNDVAIAYLDVRCNGEYWVVTGSSRRTPGDRPNKEVGMALAISRAYERFARQLARQANGAVENNDWVQQDHRARAAAKMKVAKKTAVAKKRAAAKKGKK